jgi:phosphoribulokinase/uridine kinase family protein
MEKINSGEEVVLPKFEFSEQCRRDGEKLRRNKNDIVVFEGIHALNPEVTGAAGDYARCMYVSVRSRLELKDGELLHPCYIRLMRRLIRDGFFRGRSAAETLDMFDSVEAGENKYIMPYKHRAEFSVDTFHAYEPALYKNYLLDTLRRESRSYKDFERFLPMLKALEEIEPVMLESVPVNSLAREFVGESSYSY